MATYGELARVIAGEIAAGRLQEGGELPALRAIARAHAASQATALRAYRELAEAGVVTTEERRIGRVAAGGTLAAQRYLRSGAVFRLAGSDDPALLMLAATVRAGVDLVSTAGSFAGLAALRDGSADGATLHLWHVAGTYNAPYARGVLDEPLLVHLWRREAGLIVAPGNPHRIRTAAGLAGLRVARRPVGTGARALLDRVTVEEGIVLDATDPEVARGIDVALAVASGSADAGVASRGLARRFDLDFVEMVWEPFEIAVEASAAGGLEPLLRALRDPAMRANIEALGGYDLTRSGETERP
jgi:molybdate-binding protein